MAGYVKDQAEFAAISRQANEMFVMDSRLPQQVFRGFAGRTCFTQFSFYCLPELWDIVAGYVPCKAVVLTVDPDPETYFFRHFGYFSSFVVEPGDASTEILELVDQAPSRSPADSMLVRADVVVFFPVSGAWGLWLERISGFCVFGCNSDTVLARVMRAPHFCSLEEAIATWGRQEFLRAEAEYLAFSKLLRENYGD